MTFRAFYPVAGIGAMVVYAAVVWLLRDHPLARAVFGNAALVLSAAVPLTIILYRRRTWAGCQRLFWNTIAFGTGLWIVGHFGWAVDSFRHQQSWLQWHTIFSLCAGISPLLALMARPHRGVRPHAPGTIGIDLAASGLLALFVYTYFVLVPSLVPAMVDEARGKLLLLVQVNRALLVVGFATTAWFARRTEWRGTFLRLTTGAAIGFVLRFGTNSAIARGAYEVGSLYDLAWIVPWLFYGWAAITSPASDRSARTVFLTEAPTPLAFSAIPVLLIPAIGYGMLYLHDLAAPADSFRALLTSVTTVCGLVLLTIRMAAQGGELQRADAQLKLLAAALEQTADLILITRADGRFEHANQAFLTTLGYTRRDLEHHGLWELVEADSGLGAGGIAEHVRQHGIWRGTLQRRRHDGSTFPSACIVVALRDAAGLITHFVSVERDISEELRLRDQLVHTERLSAIGELVAGVAHEINNPLQTIVGTTELMLDYQAEALSRNDLEIVRREAARAGQIVRNLLTFVRRGTPHRTSCDLSQIVNAAIELRRFHFVQHKVEVVTAFAPEPLHVLVNREEIQQVAMNLLLNAEHALRVTSGPRRIEVATRGDGEGQVLEVADNGPGVSPDLRGRIFEPFFTTREVGEGTGLGLSISHGIATAHGGSLELIDSSGGARFRLTLPAMPAAAVDPGAPVAATAARRALVVDDEAPIRTMLKRMLERKGYDVLEAASADDATRLASTQVPDLVLCDVRMPGTSGLELYRSLTSSHPSTRSCFIMISGDSSARDRAELADVPFLAKPFTAADLDALLARIGLQSRT